VVVVVVVVKIFDICTVFVVLLSLSSSALLSAMLLCALVELNDASRQRHDHECQPVRERPTVPGNVLSDPGRGLLFGRCFLA